MLTPFGTSANLIVLGQAARSGITLTMLDFFPAGHAAAALVLICVTLAAPVLLRARADTAVEEVETYHLEGLIPPGSPLAGKSVVESQLRQLERFFLVEVMRGGRVLSPVKPDEV